MDIDDDDLTVPQQRTVRNLATMVAEQHISKTLKRVWLSLMALVATIIGQSIYIAYNTGARVQQQEMNTATIANLVTARISDESQLSYMNATLTQMQIQLNHIDSKLEK